MLAGIFSNHLEKCDSETCICQEIIAKFETKQLAFIMQDWKDTVDPYI